MKILFAGGGTAGHIFPIIAIAREIKKRQNFLDKGLNYQAVPSLKFFYLGPRDEFSEMLLANEGIEVKWILAGKMRRYFGIKSFLQNIIDLLIKAPIGFFQAFFYIFVISPDIIFSKGGYGSLPAAVSGWLLLTPIFLHESDAVPGLTNRLSAKFATEILVSFPAEKTGHFPSQKMISVGNPVRTELLIKTPGKTASALKLTGNRPLLLILGGSQGSQRINDVILTVLPEILLDFEIIHQVGKNNFRQVDAEAKVVLDQKLLKYYHIFPFLEERELKQAYQAADLVISRAGSGTIFEVAAFGKPSVLIPLPESAQNHQVANAYVYQESKACLVIEEINLTPHFFLERIEHLISQPEKLREMQFNARVFSKPQAARIIAEYILEYLTQ